MTTDAAPPPTTPETPAPTQRSLERLFVHADTLACALQQRCIPCGYKIALHARPSLLPNQRPEMCPRIKIDTVKTKLNEAPPKKGKAKDAAKPAEKPQPKIMAVKPAAADSDAFYHDDFDEVIADGEDLDDDDENASKEKVTDEETGGDEDSGANEPEEDAAPVDAKKHCSIGLYDETHVKRLLTVGDGNFSFSLALARAFACSAAGVQLVVTSHESRKSVVETYPDGEAILKELGAMKHVTVKHQVDATNAKQMAKLGQFDRVLWNFPCVRVPKGKDGQNEEMELNKALLHGFFAHVASMLSPTGEVHVTHKTKPPFSQWGMEEIAARSGLCLAQSVVFDRCLYPGYSNKKVLSKGSFPIWDSETFVFVPASRETKEAQNVAALEPMTSELLAKAYLILTPTLQEKLEHEARLLKMKQRMQEKLEVPAASAATKKGNKKDKKTQAAAAAAVSVTTTAATGTKRKQGAAQLANQKKNKKQKGGKFQRR